MSSHLGGEADVSTACPASGAALTLGVREGRLGESSALVHFALRPRDWWASIGDT